MKISYITVHCCQCKSSLSNILGSWQNVAGHTDFQEEGKHKVRWDAWQKCLTVGV